MRASDTGMRRARGWVQVDSPTTRAYVRLRLTVLGRFPAIVNTRSSCAHTSLGSLTCPATEYRPSDTHPAPPRISTMSSSYLLSAKFVDSPLSSTVRHRTLTHPHPLRPVMISTSPSSTSRLRSYVVTSVLLVSRQVEHKSEHDRLEEYIGPK
jgi:hypothetical protein